MLNKSSEKCGHNNDFVLNSSGSITKCKLVWKLPLLGYYNVFWKSVILKNCMNSIKLSHTRDSRLQMCALRSNYLYFSKLTPPPPHTLSVKLVLAWNLYQSHFFTNWQNATIPLAESTLAVSLPIPVLAPVIITVLPYMVSSPSYLPPPK